MTDPLHRIAQGAVFGRPEPELVTCDSPNGDRPHEQNIDFDGGSACRNPQPYTNRILQGHVTGRPAPELNFHTVTVMLEKGLYAPVLAWTCTAPFGASCRMACPTCEDACDSPITDERHVPRDQGECLVIPWLENADDVLECLTDHVTLGTFAFTETWTGDGFDFAIGAACLNPRPVKGNE